MPIHVEYKIKELKISTHKGVRVVAYYEIYRETQIGDSPYTRMLCNVTSKDRAELILSELNTIPQRQRGTDYGYLAEWRILTNLGVGVL